MKIIGIKNSIYLAYKRTAELSALCNELRCKLKAALTKREQNEQAVNVYETKFYQAERQIKDLEGAVIKVIS